MDNWLFILILILLCSIWLWLHHSVSNSSHKHKTPSPTKRRPKSYHGVTIHPCHQACEYVNRLKGKRFLASEVAELPIYGCANPECCSCTYIHHDDRRTGEDRRYPSIAMQAVFSEKEQRSTRKDRRKNSFA